MDLFQLNTHNCYQALTEVGAGMSRCEEVVYALQEPYINNKKELSNTPKGYDVFPGHKGDHPRVAIFATRQLQLVELSQFTDRYHVAVKGTIGGFETIIASILFTQ